MKLLPKSTDAPDAPNHYQLDLTKGSANVLKQLLQAPKWATSPKAQRRGSKLLRALGKEKPPSDSLPDAQDAWAAEPLEIVVDESLRKIGCDCITHFSKEGAFGAGEHIDVLLSEFGVVED